MTFLRKITVTESADGLQDHFRDVLGAWRTSDPYTMWSGKSIVDEELGLWEHIPTGSASYTFNQFRASVSLNVTASAGDAMIRQTRYWWPYQSSKTHRPIVTGIFNVVAGITERLGYYDDDDGMYIEHDSTGVVNFVLRSRVSGVMTEDRFPRSSWTDKLDGNGPSGLVFDETKTIFFAPDFEWLGVGPVRFGLLIGQKLVYPLILENTNQNSSVYMSSPNLPIRYEIINVTGANTGSLECICSSVSSEGGSTPKYKLRTGDRGASAITIAGGGTNAIISVRKKSTAKYISVLPVAFTSFCPTNPSSGYLWRLVLNPTFSSGSHSWVSGGQGLEFDTAMNGTVTGYAVELGAGYVSGEVDQAASALIDIDRIYGLGQDNDGTSDVASLIITNLGGGNESFYGSLSCKEWY